MDNGNDTVSSTSRKEETIATKRHNKLIKALTSQSLPIIPFDLIPDILCRLPVKLLLQFRCVCKSWNSLISDPKFAKKHLLSTTHRINTFHNSVFLDKYVLISYPFDSVFTDITTNHNVTYLDYNFKSLDQTFVGSCNGILCLADIYKGLFVLWNPSIRKFKKLPTFQNPQQHFLYKMIMYGFGYDSGNDNYKVVAGINFDFDGSIVKFDFKFDFKVHTLGTNFWKSISGIIPFHFHPCLRSGKFVCGKMNWLAYNDFYRDRRLFILSLDLEDESYQKVLLPDFDYVDRATLYLNVMRDCLCMIRGHDVWLMKEFGNKESWTKLLTISYIRDYRKCYASIETRYIFEDDQMLLVCVAGHTLKLILYNCRNGTFKETEIEDYTPTICVESLISPCL